MILGVEDATNEYIFMIDRLSFLLHVRRDFNPNIITERVIVIFLVHKKRVLLEL